MLVNEMRRLNVITPFQLTAVDVKRIEIITIIKKIRPDVFAPTRIFL